jgi:hypothetical protein
MGSKINKCSKMASASYRRLLSANIRVKLTMPVKVLKSPCYGLFNVGRLF